MVLASSRIRRLLLATVMVIALVFHLWGIRRDLPYVNEDTTWITRPAVDIATSGDLNPRVFAYPGSTLIYPLAAAYHVWHAVVHGGRWLGPDPHLRSAFESHPAGFLLVGRLLTVTYAVLSVPLVYAIGQAAFSAEVGLIGAFLAAVQPSEIFDKRIDTNSASMFFCLLGLWGCLRLYRRPTLRNQLIAGVGIGLAIGTKYYLGTLVVGLLLVDVALLREARVRAEERWGVRRQIVAGLAAVALGFLACTPYFIVDLPTVSANIGLQFGKPHLGADGLSHLGNFLWYFTAALPSSYSWPQQLAAAVGVALVLWRRQFTQLLLLMFAFSFIAGISVSSLHWVRWLIPILPVISLFVAEGLCTSVEVVSARAGLASPARAFLLAGAAVLLAVPSMRQLIRIDRAYCHPSTTVLARQWVEKHLPAGSSIAYEWDTLPPALQRDWLRPGVWINRAGNLTELVMSRLSVRGTLGYYRRHGYLYLVTSSAWYARYSTMPAQYPQEAAFYRMLLARGRLLHQVSPSATAQGPEIRIYDIRY